MGVRIPEYEAEETRGAQERGGRTRSKLIVWKKSQKMSMECKVKRLKLFLVSEFCESMMLCRGTYCRVLSLGHDVLLRENPPPPVMDWISITLCVLHLFS